MKERNMFNIQKLMKQAQEMQKKVESLQNELLIRKQ